MEGGIEPAVGVEARGLVGPLGALAIMLARGTAVGFVAWREKDTVGGAETTGTVVPPEGRDPEGSDVPPDCRDRLQAAD